MSPRKALAPEGDHGAFAQKLRYWRQMRRLSQLDLALSSGVSQRHVSFLESGRAKPSRTMILQLSESLGVPLRERNDFLVAGGFAPMFKARPLDDPQMAQVLGAVRMMLDSHAPFPAVAIDRAWNIRLSNAAFDRIGMMMGEDVWARVGGDSRNLMRLFFHPDGIRNLVLNWRAIAPLLWHRAQREADTMAGEDMQALLGALRPFQDEHTLGGASSAGLVPVLPLELGAGEVRLSMFSVIATFGTALDITAEELRIESFFPPTRPRRIYCARQPRDNHVEEERLGGMKPFPVARSTLSRDDPPVFHGTVLSPHLELNR